MGIFGLAHALQREIQDQRMQVEPQTFRKKYHRYISRR